MKILISSWPGSGATTLAVILAKELNYKWIKGTDVFRFLGSKMNFSDTGSDRIEADRIIEEQFGHVFDKYIQKILQDSSYNNIVLESDIAGFLTAKNDKFLSVFLYSNLESRKARLVQDKRVNDEDFLEHRQKDLQEIYMKLHGIDFLDEVSIKEHYSLPIDNTKVTIADELKQVYKEMNAVKTISDEECSRLSDLAELAENDLWQKGKSYFQDYLKTNNLIMQPEEIIKDINLSFKDDVTKFDKSLKNIIQSID